MDYYVIEGRRYNIDTAPEILQKMIDDEPSDNEGEADSRDDKDYVPSADDIKEEDNVEIEEFEDDLLLEADSDECYDDTNHVGQYFTAKNGIKWYRNPPQISQTPAHNTIREKFGPKGSSPISMKDCLKMFITEQVTDIIIRETNREAKRIY